MALRRRSATNPGSLAICSIPTAALISSGRTLYPGSTNLNDSSKGSSLFSPVTWLNLGRLRVQPCARSVRRMWYSSSSAVQMTPPSMVEMWCEKKPLKLPITPWVPHWRSPKVAPSDSQLSSMNSMPRGSQMARMRSKSFALPRRFTTMTSRVRSLMAASSASRS